GQSMGGTLALHMATHLPVNGVITCAAPVHYQHRFLRFMPLAQKLISTYPKRHGSDVRDEKMKAAYKTYPLLSAYRGGGIPKFSKTCLRRSSGNHCAGKNFPFGTRPDHFG
ncbi:hypothetical protein KAH55_10250, partial [bacterium]|nr:hypothetical protein [bacterium]